MKQITNWFNKRRYAIATRTLRQNISSGDSCLVVRGGKLLQATVLNVRYYEQGATEVYAMDKDQAFMGWITLESVLPLEAGNV